jgi:hypothetical protein
LPPTQVSTSLIKGDQVVVESANRITIKATGVSLPIGEANEYVAGRPIKALNLWEEGRLVDQRIYTKGAPWPPPAEQLVADPQKYTETTYLYLASVRDGVIYTYCPGGYHGPAAIDDLINRVAARWRDYPGAWPICLLGGRGIPTREYGTKWVMTFLVTAWSLPDGTRIPA